MRIESYPREIKEYSIRSLPTDRRIEFGSVIEYEDNIPECCPNMKLELTDYLSNNWETSIFPFASVRHGGLEHPQRQELETYYREILKGELPNWRLVGLTMFPDRRIWLSYQFACPVKNDVTYQHVIELKGLNNISFKIVVNASVQLPEENYVFEFEKGFTTIHEQIGIIRRKIDFRWNVHGNHEAVAEVTEYVGIM